MVKFGILGVGKMGSSILQGVLKSNLYKAEEIGFYTPNKVHQIKYSQFGVGVFDDEKELFSTCEIILLAIKPQVYESALENAKGIDFTNKVIISLAPGKSIEYLKAIFSNALIARAMPNTPALIQKATTTLAFSSDNKLKQKVIDIFSSIGSATEVKENQIDEALPLNGSMPAYLFAFAKAFIDNGVAHGLTYEQAKELCGNAIIGSACLMLESKDNLDTLINNVCSKGGTTIEGLNKLYENNFNEAIKSCYDACVDRSKELANK